ncbi:TniQ family protein [Pseudomonas sp. MPFS]|uniref:TniQ family protein n=1 Tax=unclassified Pseudomonas TaxID=196821 RepID=UPI003217FCFB
MKFKGLPKPVFDETLTSWLFRCSVNRRSRVGKRLRLEGRPEAWWVGIELKTADADIDFVTAEKKLREAGYETNSLILEIVFGPQGKRFVEWNFRRLFCVECLRQDVSEGRLPIWRKSWCYEFASDCFVHRKQLDSLVAPLRYSKAWDAFVQHCKSNANRISSADIFFARLRASTLSRIAKAAENGTAEDHYDLSSLLSRLTCILLQAPFKGTHGGSARIHFQARRGIQFAAPNSLLESFSVGAATADSSSRIGGMVIASTLLGIIPESRFLEFVQSYEVMNVNSILPRNLLQAAAFPQLDRIGYGVLHDYLGYVPRSRFPVLDRHLQLQEDRYKREGVFDGRPLGLIDRA